MTHKTEKILAQIAQDPTKSRLIEIGVSVETLEKEKRELKASKGNLDKNTKNARLAEINTELSNLKAEKENIKKSKPAKSEAPQKPTAEPVAIVDQPVVVTSEGVAPQEPLNTKAETVVGDNEKLANLAKIKEEKKQEDIKAIKLGKDMRKGKDELEKAGIDRALIDSIYDVPPQKEVDQKKIDAVMQQILLYIESEREEEEEYQKERAKKIARLEANEKKLTELIELRSKLLAQEKSEKKPEEPSVFDSVKSGVPTFLTKKIEAEMRSAGITEEQIYKLPIGKLWDLFQQKTLEKEIQEQKEKLEDANPENESEKDQPEVIRGEPEKTTQPIELSIELPEGDKKESTPKATESELETDENEPEPESQKTEEDRLKIDEGASQNIQNMQRMIVEFQKNRNIYNQKSGELAEIEYTDYGWKVWKYATEYFRKKNIEKERNEIIKRQEELLEKFEQEERKEFPVAYYAVEKIKDPVIKNLFMATDKNGPYISMRHTNNIATKYSTRVFNPAFIEISQPESNKEIAMANVFGFSMRTLYINKVLDKNSKYKLDNPEARFDVVGPDGKIIAEYVDYENGLSIYRRRTWEYAQRVEEEWNKLNKK